jgi:hypothetical protein
MDQWRACAFLISYCQAWAHIFLLVKHGLPSGALWINGEHVHFVKDGLMDMLHTYPFQLTSPF